MRCLRTTASRAAKPYRECTGWRFPSDSARKEAMDKQLQEISDAEDCELIDRLTPSTEAEIETAIRVVQRINYGAA